MGEEVKIKLSTQGSVSEKVLLIDSLTEQKVPGIVSHIGCVILSKRLNLCFIICKIPIIILIVQVTVFKTEQSLQLQCRRESMDIVTLSFSGWKVL